jgi:hypothetical protein
VFGVSCLILVEVCLFDVALCLLFGVACWLFRIIYKSVVLFARFIIASRNKQDFLLVVGHGCSTSNNYNKMCTIIAYGY